MGRKQAVRHHIIQIEVQHQNVQLPKSLLPLSIVSCIPDILLKHTDIATASEDCTIILWTPLTSKKPVTRMTGHQKQINQVTFSPDGALLASAAWDNHVKLWSARDGKFLNTLRAHVGPVYMTCFSADSRLLASCSKDTTLKVWDMRTGKLKEDLPGHKDQVFALDWSPDGERVGSGGADKQVRIWSN